MESMKIQSSKLFIHTSVDVRDKFEEKYERAYQSIQSSIYGPNAKELNVLITSMVSLDNKQQEEIQNGFIYIILTDTGLASKTIRDLLIATRDGLGFFVDSIVLLIAEKYQKLSDIAKSQLLWLFRELMKINLPMIKLNNILWTLFRQAVGGDVSGKNIILIEGILDTLIEQRTKFDKFPPMVGLVAFTYVRLIEDHITPNLTPLRLKEVKFVISLIRDRFHDIIPLGRDFVRLLQNIARIPEFEQLWKDMLNNPTTLCPTFTSLFQMLQIRTSRQFLANRISPEIERKLHFLTSSVKFGNHKRYQDWFQDRYFNTPESQSLRSDLIRYIINAIHPTNDMLCSDIIPRWAIIGWLLTSCTNPVALANAKLAVFYDWLFFDPQKDNIMNVEPGILVMYHSIKNVPVVSTTLLDFLCRIMKNFYPRGEDRIRAGVYNSLKIILEKQVIPNLYPLFQWPKLDRELKQMLHDNFKEFTPNIMEEKQVPPPNHYPIANYMEIKAPNSHIDLGKLADDLTNEKNDPKFSDDEDESLPKKMKLEEIPIEEKQSTDDDDEDDDDLPLAKVRLKTEKPSDKVELPSAIKESFSKFLSSKTIGDFETFLTDFRTGGVTLDQDQEAYLHENVATICKSTLPEKCDLGDFKCAQKLENSISYPLFGLFKVLHQYEEKCKKCILDLLEFTYQRIPETGFLLLYFLKVYAKVRKNQNSSLVFKTNVYKQLCQCASELKTEACLEKDLELLEKYSLNMFLYLLPDIYREFEQYMVNNSEVLRIVVSCVDAKNLRDLIFNVTQGKLVIFKNDGVIDVIRDSLEYETFEQICMWQLVQAHDVPIKYVQEILPELESSNHEALTYMLFLLKNEEPTAELVRLLLSRETKSRGDPFVTSALRYWCVDYEEKISEIIASLLTSKYPTNSPTKRKRPLKSSATSNSVPTSDQLLNHLEHFRRSCRHGNGTGTGLYVQEGMQRALQQAFSHSTDGQKKQFSDLFALAAEDETSGTVSRRGTSSRGGRKPPTKKESSSASTTSTSNKKSTTIETNNKYSSGESTDEDWSKQTKQAAKKRKKTTVLSDSE
ncbi:unnamed protein product [Diamesa tonsa]